MTPFSKIAASFLLLLSVAGLVYGIIKLQANEDLPVLGEPGHRAGNFSFTNQDGHTITEKEVAGKIAVAEYFFTRCPGICKQMNAHLQMVYQQFKDVPDFVILSHTVDPERDSVPVLKEYAARYGAVAGRWQLLTGNKELLYRMARQEYLLSVEETKAGSIEEDFIHTQYVCLLDNQRRIRGFYDATDSASIEKLMKDIRVLRRR